jgi:hypothetical protein
MSKSLNCHFVSRFLTKPWEFGQRMLHFYDVKAQSFGLKSSKVLFARRGINSPAAERRLDQLIETPLASAIAGWRTVAPGPDAPISDWPVFRALALIFMFQVARTTKATAQPEELAAMCAWPDSKADEYAWGMNQLHTFVFVHPSAAYPLYYPSPGYFVVPLLGTLAGPPGALAIPLTERLAVISLRKTYDARHLRSILCAGGGALVSKLSVGTNADRVVVHPGLLIGRRPAELGKQIAQMQKDNLRVLQAVADMKSLTLAAFAEVGIPPQEALNWMDRKSSRT